MALFLFSFLVLCVCGLWNKIMVGRIARRVRLINPRDVDQYFGFNGVAFRYSYFRKQIKNGVLDDPTLDGWHRQLRIIPIPALIALLVFIAGLIDLAATRLL